MKLLTWKDVERMILCNRNIWDKYIRNIFVYRDAVSYTMRDGKNKPDIDNCFFKIFGKHYKKEYNSIFLDTGDKLKLEMDDYEFSMSIDNAPLFKNAYYGSITEQDVDSLKKEVVAFHSYKGGVGRTLSLLAFAQSWSDCFNSNNKLLIVDADIEAPGMTWLLKEKLPKDVFSYLDLLDLIQDNDNVEKIVDIATKYIEKNIITVDDGKRIVSHYFIPLYRYRGQLLDMYSTPSIIVKRKSKNYVLAEVLSKIADKLNAGAVAVDLRAGISEYSAPLLFDCRVKKYIISSTSKQSIIGCNEIIKRISQVHNTNNSANYKVILNMVPVNELSKVDIVKIEDELMKECLVKYTTNNDDDYDYANYILTSEFASELIHLDDFINIMIKLSDRELSSLMKKEINENFNKNKSVTDVKMDKKISFVNKLHDVVYSKLTSEAQSNIDDMMMIAPIKNIVNDYRDSLPVSIVMGAKGVGKTFLYRRLVLRKNWKNFCSDYGISSYDANIIPIIAPNSIHTWSNELKQCIKDYYDDIGLKEYDDSIYLTNSADIKATICEKTKMSDRFLSDFWMDKILSRSIYPGAKSIIEADRKLEAIDKKVIVVLDGFEEILQSVKFPEDRNNAIRVLCQDVVNYISSRCNNIGMISFVRRDLLTEAIKVNLKQFEEQFKKYELLWSHTEAIKLVYWLVAKTGEKGFKEEDIDKISISVLIDRLTILWGRKLGPDNSNEAYTVRWILGALSDFNGQLSARDMIRFIENVTKIEIDRYNENNVSDRYLSSGAIKNAVKESSNQKIEEVKQEYMNLKDCFEKLEEMSKNVDVPINPDDLTLTKDQISSMKKAGFLKEADNKYYLPECIREGLGFKSNGARPKVLSLMNISKIFMGRSVKASEITGEVTVK